MEIKRKKVAITIDIPEGCGVNECWRGRGRISRGWIAHEDVSKGRNYDAVSFLQQD